MPRQAVQRREQLRLGERIERCDSHAGGGRWQPDEIALGAAGLRHVEARQTDRRRHDVEVGEDPGSRPSTRELHLIHKESRRDAEAHDVDQTVELSAKPRPCARYPRYAAIEYIEIPTKRDDIAKAAIGTWKLAPK